MFKNSLSALLLLLFFIACKKEETKQLVKKEKFALSAPKVLQAEGILKTDTIRFETQDDNFVLAHLYKQEVNKDSVKIAYFQLDFYNKKHKIKSHKVAIKGYDEGAEWGGSHGLNDESTNSPFIQISLGFPACGYTQNHFLYYKTNHTVEFIEEWDSMSDSGWGSWVDFSGNPSSTVFYTHRTSFSPQDDNDEMGLLELSDSIKFERINNKWKKKLITPKDSVYRSKTISVNEFYKQS